MDRSKKVEDINFPVIVKRSPAALAVQTAVLLFFSLLLFIFVIILSESISSLANSAIIGFSLVTIALTLLVVANATAIIIALLKWGSDVYEIHEDEIVFAQGIFSKKRLSFPLDKVETMNVSQNFFERMFDFGDISLLNPVLPSNRRLKLLDVPHPQRYLDLIKTIQQNLLEQSPRNGHTIYMQDQK